MKGVLPIFLIIGLVFSFSDKLYAQNSTISKILKIVKSDKHLNHIKSTFFHKTFEQEERVDEDENEKEYDSPDLAAAFEYAITKDPSTGKVPRERMLIAGEKIKRMKLNAMSPSSSSRSVSLNWIERGPNSDVVGPFNGNTRANYGIASGRVRAILVDSSDVQKKTIWIGGVDGGLWKTTDITAVPANWTLVNDFLNNLAVTDICQDPSNYNTMYFCTGESFGNVDAVKGNGVYKSVDHGVTWVQLSSTSGYGFCTRIICDYLGNVYLATKGNGLLRSNNGGTSWTNITPSGISNDICDLEISATAVSGRLHVVSGIFSNQTYRYTDNPSMASSTSGWNAPVTAFPSYNNRAEITCRGNVLFALPVDGAYQVPAIYRSTDGGVNWYITPAQPSAGWASKQGWYALGACINPANTLECIIGGLDSWKTSDGGASWSKISTWVGTSAQYVHADIHKVLWFDRGNKLLFGCDGGIHYSADGGVNISDRNQGLRIKQFYSCAIHPNSTNYFLGGAQDNGTHQFANAGLSASTEVFGGDGGFVAIDQNEPQYQIGTYVYNAYRVSGNSGLNWNNCDFYKGSSYSPISFGSFINPYDYDNSNNILYAGADGGEFFRWTTVSSTPAGSYYLSNGFPSGASIITGIPEFNNASVSTVKVSPFTSNRVYFGTSQGRIVYLNNANIASSNTSAVNITGASMPLYANVSCINVGTSDQYLIASFSNYGVSNVWYSTNGGAAWTAIDGNLPDMPVRWCMFFPGDNTKAIIATEAGVFISESLNGASTIWNVSSTFPVVKTTMLKYRGSDGTLLASTFGRGMWSASLITCQAPVLSVSNNSPLCANKTLTLAATCDQSSSTYSWTGPNGFVSSVLSPSISNVSVLAAGTYTLTATIGSCYTSISTTVSINASPSAPTATVVSPSCTQNTGSITVTSSLVGLNFSIDGVNYSNTSGVFSSLNPGNYLLTSRNGIGCASTANSLTVGQRMVIPNSPTMVGATRCNAGTVQLSGTAGSGQTIDWYAASSGGTALRMGSLIYSPTVSNTTVFYAESRQSNTGCVSPTRSPVTATVNSSSITNQIVTSCNSYFWKGVTYTSSGNYIYTTQNYLGCDSIVTLMLTINKSSSSSSQNETICSSQLPFVWNGTNYLNSGIFIKTLSNVSGCDSTATLNLTVNYCESTIDLNLKLFLEGLYVGGGLQRSVLYDLGISSLINETDTIEVDLWSPNSLSKSVSDYNNKVVLKTDGTVKITYPPDLYGRSFYIAIKHRNSIQTWSSQPIYFSGNMTYDFTNSSLSAYSNGNYSPQKLLGSGKYGIYAGDVNQDGIINSLDLQMVQNGAASFETGYNTNDCTGDGKTDLLDLQVVENNSRNFIYFSRPF